MIPSGFIALLSGWFVTEIGRQPYTAYNVLRTAQSVSPAILGPQVAWSLLAFVIIYSIVFGSGLFYILKIIKHGVLAVEEQDSYYKNSLEASIMDANTKGDNHV